MSRDRYYHQPGPTSQPRPHHRCRLFNIKADVSVPLPRFQLCSFDRRFRGTCITARSLDHNILPLFAISPLDPIASPSSKLLSPLTSAPRPLSVPIHSLPRPFSRTSFARLPFLRLSFSHSSNRFPLPLFVPWFSIALLLTDAGW